MQTQAAPANAKILAAIADCDRYITREERLSDDLRPAEVRERLAWYKQHRAKLQDMLPKA